MAKQQHELADMQGEIGQEINSDAPQIARSLFGDKMPDMGKTSDEEAMGMLRQAYQSGNRDWLVGEARRDPNQFLRLAKQLGVQVQQ